MVEFHNPLTSFMKNVLLDLPFSRKCESEADYIGLLLMSKSCYDPDEAIKLWQRMSERCNSSPDVSSFFSTHPSNTKRIENIRSWLPEARALFNSSECNDFLFNSFINRNRNLN